jgi:hypothetical protein
VRSLQWVSLSGTLVALLVGSMLVRGATPAPTAESVEMFQAMKAGDIDVKLFLKDSTGGTVTITNKSKKPLTIKLPEAFAGVPIQAQFGGGMMGGGMGMGGMGGGMMGGGMGGMNQGFGGGMMGGGMGGGMMGGRGGMMGGGMGGGFFNVAPEKAGKLKVVGVCLDHGKKDPNPRVVYDVKPIEVLAKDPQLIEVVKMIARGEVRQHAGQAAAWHLANGLTWEQLAAKIGAKHLNGSTEPYFTREDLASAMRMEGEANRRADQLPPKSSPGESVSQLSSAQASTATASAAR